MKTSCGDNYKKPKARMWWFAIRAFRLYISFAILLAENRIKRLTASLTQKEGSQQSICGH